MENVAIALWVVTAAGGAYMCGLTLRQIPVVAVAAHGVLAVATLAAVLVAALQT